MTGQTPIYDQEFFLALAANGKVAWNTWRHDPANNDVHVTFASVDFSQAPLDQIDFSGFDFGNNADFSWCKWPTTVHSGISSVVNPVRASFSGATFGDFADFREAKFGVRAEFSCTTFGNVARFAHARFFRTADFSEAIFGTTSDFTGADFTGAEFYDRALFPRAVCGDDANFAYADFHDPANFSEAVFGQSAAFSSANFDKEANFAGTAFGTNAKFDQVLFKCLVSFVGMPAKRSTINFAGTPMIVKAREALEKQHRESRIENSLGPDRFSTISFARASFRGAAIFVRRSFEGPTDFTNARFYSPPNFDSVTNFARIDFTGARIRFVPPDSFFNWTSAADVPIRLRALRKVVEETKNHDLERDLYIEERKAERGVYLRQLLDELKRAPEELRRTLKDINNQKKHVWLEWRLQRRARNAYWLGIVPKIARLFTHLLWIGVMGIYWLFSDYGRSFVRPLAWLIASGFFFYWRYLAALAKLMAKAPDIERYEQALRIALGNTVPFVGPLTIDSKVKEFLLCPAVNCTGPLVPPEGYQLLVLSQNLLSIILVFFIGLALRNYFKIK